MSDEKIEIARGSGNVYRDLGMDDADLRQLKALLAAEILKTLDKLDASVRDAQALTGIAAADYSRIRGAKLDRFTADRLMIILGRLGREVRFQLTVRQRPAVEERPSL